MPIIGEVLHRKGQLRRAMIEARAVQIFPHCTTESVPSIDKLGSERMDIGFIRGFELAPLASNLIATMIMKEPLLLAMRSDHPLAHQDRAPSIADLRDEAWVLYQSEFGAGFNDHLERLCARAGFAPRAVQEALGLSTLLGLVAAGMGVTILTRSLAVLHPENIVFRQLDDPEAVSSLWLIHRERMSTAARRFVDLFARQVVLRDDEGKRGDANGPGS
jgi:DNA-binding transcriptional LysR family regulator